MGLNDGKNVRVIGEVSVTKETKETKGKYIHLEGEVYIEEETIHIRIFPGTLYYETGKLILEIFDKNGFIGILMPDVYGDVPYFSGWIKDVNVGLFFNFKTHEYSIMDMGG